MAGVLSSPDEVSYEGDVRACRWFDVELTSEGCTVDEAIARVGLGWRGVRGRRWRWGDRLSRLRGGGADRHQWRSERVGSEGCGSWRD